MKLEGTLVVMESKLKKKFNGGILVTEMNILWFRRGLRLHDNPALLSALENKKKFAAVYIFDPPGIFLSFIMTNYF